MAGRELLEVLYSGLIAAKAGVRGFSIHELKLVASEDIYGYTTLLFLNLHKIVVEKKKFIQSEFARSGLLCCGHPGG